MVARRRTRRGLHGCAHKPLLGSWQAAKRARRRIGHVARRAPVDGSRRHDVLLRRTNDISARPRFMPTKKIFENIFFFETLSKYMSVRNKEQPCGSWMLDLDRF